MIEHLIKHIEAFGSIPPELSEALKKIAKPMVVEKGVFLHRPEKVCKNTFFIHSGLLRIYYQLDGKEVTDNFCAEGEWITSVYSFMRNIPDNFYIETLEQSSLLAIDFFDLDNCFRTFPEMERFGRMLMSSLYVDLSERMLSLKFHSAKEKYQYFCKASKNKLHRVPLGMLASYLGITQETLSRIRAEKGAF